MWVDLSLESKSTNRDKDDDWFYISHLFHAKELKAAFPCIGEMTVDMQRPSSPNLPPSVARSRGKDYRNKEWVKGNQKITLDKKHAIKNLNAIKNSGKPLCSMKQSIKGSCGNAVSVVNVLWSKVEELSRPTGEYESDDVSVDCSYPPNGFPRDDGTDSDMECT